MIHFSNDAELFQFLLDGGTLIEKEGDHRRELKLVDGLKTYTKGDGHVEDGSSAKKCILSYNWWEGKYGKSKEKKEVITMTDRLKGVCVSFKEDIREDDAQAIIDAIKMIKGVHEVRTSVAGPSDFINRSMVKREVQKKLLHVIEEL